MWNIKYQTVSTMQVCVRCQKPLMACRLRLAGQGRTETIHEVTGITHYRHKQPWKDKATTTPHQHQQRFNHPRRPWLRSSCLFSNRIAAELLPSSL